VFTYASGFDGHTCDLFGDIDLVDELLATDLLPAAATNVVCEYRYNEVQGYVVTCSYDLFGTSVVDEPIPAQIAPDVRDIRNMDTNEYYVWPMDPNAP
jgi:hypothetical protein